MKIFAKEQLSAHKYKTPQGYLVCTDAILARTGKQMYKKRDFFPDAADGDSDYEVDRLAEDVFDDKAIASFENMPLVVEHPDEDVNSTNYKQYEVGFVRDVHKGEVNGQPVLLGNLVIRDEQTIRELENGEHTDLSCGYDCDVADEEHPHQTNIRGNHIALCREGRAGIAKIQDSTSKTVKYGFETVQRYNKFWDAIEGLKPDFTEKAIGHFEIEVSGPVGHGMWKKIDDLAKHLNMGINDSKLGDIDPKEGEDKQSFISRFMGATKAEYPDRKQRLAVAYSYWDKHQHDCEDSLTKDATLTGNGECHFLYRGSVIKANVYNRKNKSKYQLEDIAKKYGCKVEPMSGGWTDVWLYGQAGKEEELCKAWHEINPAYSVKELMSMHDSCKDSLVDEPKAWSEMKSLMQSRGYKLDKEGKTLTNRHHLEFDSSKQFDESTWRNEARQIADLVDRVEDKYGTPSTYNIALNSQTKHIHAVIDIDKKYVKDSVDIQKVLKLRQIAKLSKK